MSNPYTPFTPAVSNFYGREDVLAAFEKRLTPDSDSYRLAKHFLVVGDGGIGKTSLLEQMKRRVGESTAGAYSIALDIENYAVDPGDLVEDLYYQLPTPVRLTSRAKAGLGLPFDASKKEVFDRLIKNLRGGVAISFPWGIEFAPGALLRNTSSRQTLVRRLSSWCGNLLQLVAESREAVIIFVDQLGKLLELPGGSLVMRALVELMKDAVNYELCNLLLVMAIRPEQKGSLEHRFQEDVFHPSWITRIPLYSLDDEAARKAISGPAWDQGTTLEAGCTEAFRIRCGNHPYYLQIACYRLWEYLAENGRLYERPVKLSELEIEEVVREAQSAIFRAFSPEEQELLKTLALARGPMSRMQLRTRIKERRGDDLGPVDEILDSLIAHKHRPVRYHEVARAYSISHDLFAAHIVDNECSESQRRLAVLQRILDQAPETHGETGDLLTEAQLRHLWELREQLDWQGDSVYTVVASEMCLSGFAGRWASWFLVQAERLVCLPAARCIRGAVTLEVWMSLCGLQQSDDEEIRRAASEALNSSHVLHRGVGPEADWDYQGTTL